MSATIHKVAGLWQPLPSGTIVGNGTAWPFGLNSGQLIKAMVLTKSYAITSFVASGNTIDRTEPTFPNTNLQDSTAFWYAGLPNFIDTSVVGSPGQVVTDMGGSCYLFNGLFYPGMIFSMTPDGINFAATITGVGGVQIGTANFFGAMAPIYTSDMLSSASLSVTQNTAF